MLKRLLAALVAFGLATSAYAAPINTYPNATTPLAGSEKMIGTQSGATVQISATSIAQILDTATGDCSISSSFVVTCTTLNSVSPGAFFHGTNAANLTGTVPNAAIPDPSASTLGGIESYVAVTHQWINTVSTSGVPSSTQPAFTDISGTATAAQLPSNVKIRTFGTTFGDTAGSALTSGSVVYFTVPYACTISAWNITVDAGTVTFDIWKIATGTAIPTVANTITASAKPALSTGTALHSTTLTGWTTSVSANDIVGIQLNTVATAKYAELDVECDQ